MPASWKHLARQNSGGQDACGSQQGQSGEPDVPIILSQSVNPATLDMSGSAATAASRSAVPYAARCDPARAAPSGAAPTASATSRTTMRRRTCTGSDLQMRIICSSCGWSTPLMEMPFTFSRSPQTWSGQPNYSDCGGRCRRDRPLALCPTTAPRPIGSPAQRPHGGSSQRPDVHGRSRSACECMRPPWIAYPPHEPAPHSSPPTALGRHRVAMKCRRRRERWVEK